MSGNTNMPARNRAVRSLRGIVPPTLLEPGYSTVREDERIVDEGLRPRPGERILTITSGGCISLKLLLADVAEVVSIDLSPYQTALLQLKAAAVRTLAHDELWELIGLAASSRRASLYQRARAALPSEAGQYWNEHQREISAGITLMGRNDRLLHWIGDAVTAIQGRTRVEQLLRCATLDEQRAFVDREWNTRRWRAMLGVLLDHRVLGRIVDLEVSDPGERIRAEISHVLRDVPIADNFYLFYLLRRTYPSGNVCPAWLMASNQPELAKRIARLTTITGALDDYLDSAAGTAGTFDGFYLSNIFDWMTSSDVERSLERIIATARPGARLCYWTNLLNRPHAPRFAAVRRDHAAEASVMASHRAPGYSACVVATIDRNAA